MQVQQETRYHTYEHPYYAALDQGHLILDFCSSDIFLVPKVRHAAVVFRQHRRGQGTKAYQGCSQQLRAASDTRSSRTGRYLSQQLSSLVFS